MSSMRRHAVLPATVVTVALFFFTMLSGAPSAQRIASEFGAPGAPYATPEYCSALPELVNKFEKTILPQQQRDIAAQESRLREAEAGHSEAASEFTNALREGFIKLGTDQLNTGKLMAERVRGMSRSGMSELMQKEWLAKIKNIEDTGNLLKVGTARADYGELLKANQDNLVSFMKFIDDSGAGDWALKGLADLLAPGIGGVVVGGIKVGLDVAYAGLKGHFTAQEAEQWRDNVAKLRSAHKDLADRVDGYRDNLTSGLCGPKVAQQVQNSPKPIGAEGLAPLPPTVPRPPAGSGGSGIGKIIGWTAVIGGGIAGGVLLKDALAELDDLSYLDPPTTTFPTSTTTTTTPSTPPATNANYRYGNWNCGASSQCTAVFGAVTGSVGPFCTLQGCTDWGRSQGGNATCTAQPMFTMRGFPQGGRACE